MVLLNNWLAEPTFNFFRKLSLNIKGLQDYIHWICESANRQAQALGHSRISMAKEGITDHLFFIIC